MEDVYKFATILIILAISAVNKSESSDQSTEMLIKLNSSPPTSTISMSSPAITTTTITTKTTTSSLASSPSTVPSFKSTPLTTEMRHSTKVTTDLHVQTTTRPNVTMMLSSTTSHSSTSISPPSSSTQISSDSSTATSLPTTASIVPTVSVPTNTTVSTENISTSSHNTVSVLDSQPHSSKENIAGIVAGVLCSVVAVVIVAGAIFYFKRRQGRKSVVENVKVNYESEKFEDIADTDYDPTTLSTAHYEKLGCPDTGENQYTMIVREGGDTEKDETGSLEESSSYVLPNEFGVPPRVSSKENGKSSRYENTMFSLDLKDDSLPIKDEDDYIQFSEDNLKNVRVS